MKDYIDFPCSSDWLDYYHSRGLTPRSSGRADPEIKAILERIERFEKVMVELLREIKKSSSNPSPKNQPHKNTQIESLQGRRYLSE